MELLGRYGSRYEDQACKFACQHQELEEDNLEISVHVSTAARHHSMLTAKVTWKVNTTTTISMAVQ